MKIVRMSWIAVMLALLIGGNAARGDWSWPWSNKESAKATTKTKSRQPSPLTKATANTKKFFGSMLGNKKSAPKKGANRPYSGTSASSKDTKKEPLLSSWFGPKETPPPRSTDDWMKLEPIRP